MVRCRSTTPTGEENRPQKLHWGESTGWTSMGSIGVSIPGHVQCTARGGGVLGPVHRWRGPSHRLLQRAEKEHPRPGKRTADAQPRKRGVRTEAYPPYPYSCSEPPGGAARPAPNNTENPTSTRGSEGFC